MTTPKLPTQMRKLRKQNPRTDALQPLHDLANVLRGPISDEHMHMIAGYFPGDNLQLMLQGNLPQDIARPDRHRTAQHTLSVFRDPDHMYLQVSLGVGTQRITSHGDSYKLFFA